MNIQAEKIDLLQKILQVKKESVIEKIKIILEQEMIVAYTTKGKPLTQKAYNKRLAKAEKQLSQKNYVSQEELEKEIEKW